MPENKTKITYEIVTSAVETLTKENRTPTLRAIREAIGYGSLSTIQPLLKEVLASIPSTPPETEEKLRPLLSVATEAIKLSVNRATETLKSENARLQKDLDDTTLELKTFEASREEDLTTIKDLKKEIIQLQANLENYEKTLATSKEETTRAKQEADELRKELVKLQFRHEDWLEAKKEIIKAKMEAKEAGEKAARLEGRLQELERQTQIGIMTTTPETIANPISIQEEKKQDEEKKPDKPDTAITTKATTQKNQKNKETNPKKTKVTNSKKKSEQIIQSE
jgi:DNA repair exonuclease SbcCD ATPase subunit